MAEVQSDIVKNMNKIEFENENDNLGLNDDISEEDKELAVKMAKEIMEEMDAYNEEKNLEKDSIRVQNQEFVLISFVGPKLTAKTENYGMRVMGVFPDIESAADHADILKQNSNDGKFDTCVVEMYNFVYSYPITEPETQEDVDKGLNEILVKHKTECELAKQLFELRKNKLMQNREKLVEEDNKPEDVPDSVPLGPLNTNEQLNVPALEDSLEEEEDESILKARNPTHARLLKKLQKRQEKLVAKSTEVVEQLSEELINVVQKQSLNTIKTEIKLEGQTYVAICFVGNRGNNKRIATKFMGVFPNREECEKHCKMLIEFDDTYDIVPTEMYGWVPCDPDLRNVKQVHTEEQLNTMVDAHEEANDKSMKHHSERINGSKTDKEIQNEKILRNFEKSQENSKVEIVELEDEEEEEECTIVVPEGTSPTNSPSLTTNPELEAVNDSESGPKTTASELFDNMLNDGAELARESQRVV